MYFMDKGSLLSRINRIDWDFTGSQSDSVFSNIHWHPGRFMSQIPAALIGMFSEVGDTVLDPFAGSGTTIVEAQRLSRRSIGIDIGVISTLISQSKTISLSAKKITKIINRLIFDATISIQSNSQNIIIPDSVQSKKWYTSTVMKDLGRIWSLISSYENQDKVLAEVAFSSILLPVCREVRHWGYVCDNTIPKSNYEQDVLKSYVRVLDQLKEGYKERDLDLISQFGENFIIQKSDVINGNCLEILKNLTDGSIDLVLTSPPYYGVVDYVKSQRLSMEWLGHNIEQSRLLEIGARSKRHRKKGYNQYLDEINLVVNDLRRVVKSDGILIFIIGQSASRKSVLGEIREILTLNNFNTDIDLNRKVSAQRRQNPSILEEHILICS